MFREMSHDQLVLVMEEHEATSQAKDNKLDELSLLCDFLHGKIARNSRDLEDILRDLYTQIVQLKGMLQYRDVELQCKEGSLKERVQKAIGDLTDYLREEFKKEKTKLQEEVASLLERSGGRGGPNEREQIRGTLATECYLMTDQSIQTTSCTTATVATETMVTEHHSTRSGLCSARSGLGSARSGLGVGTGDKKGERPAVVVFKDRGTQTRANLDSALKKVESDPSRTPWASKHGKMKRVVIDDGSHQRSRTPSPSGEDSFQPPAAASMAGGKVSTVRFLKKGQGEPGETEERRPRRKISSLKGSRPPRPSKGGLKASNADNYIDLNAPMSSLFGLRRASNVSAASSAISVDTDQSGATGSRSEKTLNERSARKITELKSKIALTQSTNVDLMQKQVKTLRDMDAQVQKGEALEKETAELKDTRDRLITSIEKLEAEKDRLATALEAKTVELKSTEKRWKERWTTSGPTITNLREQLRVCSEQADRREAQGRKKADLLREEIRAKEATAKQLRTSYGALRKQQEAAGPGFGEDRMCDFCISMAHHMAAVEQELNTRTKNFEETVRCMWADLNATKALTIAEGGGLARIYNETQKGLLLFTEFESETQLLTEQNAALDLLNRGLEDKVLDLTLRLEAAVAEREQAEEEAAAARRRSVQTERSGYQPSPGPLCVDRNRVPAKAIKLLQTVHIRHRTTDEANRMAAGPVKAEAEGQPPVAAASEKGEDQPQSDAEATAMDAALYVIKMLLQHCADSSRAVHDDWNRVKEVWRAAETYIQTLPIHERVVSRAQLLLDKMLFRQHVVAEVAANPLSLGAHPGLMAMIHQRKYWGSQENLRQRGSVGAPTTGGFSTSFPPASPVDVSPPALMEELLAAENQRKGSPSSLSLRSTESTGQPKMQTSVDLLEAITKQEVELIKEAMAPKLASSSRKRRSQVLAPPQVQVTFQKPQGLIKLPKRGQAPSPKERQPTAPCLGSEGGDPVPWVSDEV